MAITDTYKAVVHATYLGKNVQNRFYYQQTAGPTVLGGGLNSAMRDDLVPIMASLQVDDLVYDRIEIINLDNPADFGIFTGISGITGTQLGSPMPSFVSWTFKLNRSTRNIRNGRKALAGVDESLTGGNAPTTAFQIILDAGAPIFGAPITNLTGDQYIPMLVREVLGVVSYKEAVSSAQFSRLSTQSSRK